MNQYLFTSFAASYNCGAYGTGTFDEGSVCNTSSSSSTPAQSGGLVDTGANVYIPLAAGLLLVIVAIAIIVVRLIRRKKT